MIFEYQKFSLTFIFYGIIRMTSAEQNEIEKSQSHQFSD